MRVVMTVVILAACGGALPQVPGKGGPAWLELTSEHFTLWTDASSERAHELIREMERLRQIVVGAAFPGAASASGRNLVIALRDDDELAALSPTGEPRAFAMAPSAPLYQPMFVLSAFSNRDPTDRAVAHELTHVISYGVIHHQPRWLAEGMAEFFETVELDPDSTTADLGVEPLYRGQKIRIAHLMPVARLFAWGKIDRNERQQYSTAWALFTFLINEHNAELAHYMQLVDRAYDPEVTREDLAVRAWNEAFPSLPLSSIDNVLQQWLLTGRHLIVHIKVQLVPWPVMERRLVDADVYAVRGLLHALPGNQAAQVRADVTAALADEPTNVLAWLVHLAFEQGSLTADQGRAIAMAHGEDWRAWLLASVAMSKAGGAEAEVQHAQARVCSLAARNSALSVPRALCPQTTDPPAP